MIGIEAVRLVLLRGWWIGKGGYMVTYVGDGGGGAVNCYMGAIGVYGCWYREVEAKIL